MGLREDFARVIGSFFAPAAAVGPQKHGKNPAISQIVNRPAGPVPLSDLRFRLLDENLRLVALTPLLEHPVKPARAEGQARLAFRDGEQPGVLEIISVDAEGKCVVHRVAGLALINLAFKAVDQIKRGAK